jgi:putative holliday junction resolvase
MTATHNILCLDVGERRIGVALASLEARIASPLLTLDRQETSNVYDTIKQLVHEHAATTVVVGLPRGMEGQETQQTHAVREFAETLGHELRIPIVMQDEATTSVVAEAELQQKGKPYQKGDIDKLAATYILNDWLSAQPVEEK